jgi:GNAT superfamily N-acetyltransferase
VTSVLSVASVEPMPLWPRGYGWSALAGFGPASQARYRFEFAGEEIGEIVLAISAAAPVAFIGFVHVLERHRARGYGSQIHELAAAMIGGPLVLEECCSVSEQHTIRKLALTRGWRVTRRYDVTYHEHPTLQLDPPPRSPA